MGFFTTFRYKFIKSKDKGNNIHTFSYLKDFIKKTDNILDIGSGSCFLAELINKEKECNVSCIDITDTNKTNIPLKIFDGANIPYKNDEFSVVTCCFVLHHCINQERLLSEMKRVTNDKIIIFEDTPSNIIDQIFGVFHILTSKIYFGFDSKITFRKEIDWIKTFEKHDLKLVKIIKLDKKRQLNYPVSRTMFLLKKCPSDLYRNFL